MKTRPPIYNLFDQEIRACATHLLDLAQRPDFSVEKDVEHILGRLLELHQFATKVSPEGYYQSLGELKYYLENTMLKYQDEKELLLSMRLSEVVLLLGVPSDQQLDFKPAIVRSIKKYLVSHFLTEAKPGFPLFKRLAQIKKL